MGRTKLLGATSVLGIALAAVQPAYAQSNQDLPEEVRRESGAIRPETEILDEDAENDAVDSAPIIVTGTRIRRPNLTTPVPVTSVSIDEVIGGGEVSLGDALNDLPSLRSTFSTGNSTRFIGTAGLNILDLRGLGTSRTLVLVNGRRHITTSPGDYLVDVNTIPTDLVERIDVVTGGNSAVYGSDAVAGVVNFILKRDFDGLKVTGQGGISDRGDLGRYSASVTAGRNFADGRGNVAVSFEYSKQQPVYFTDRDAQTGAFSGRNQFQVVQNTVGEPAAGDGVPDRQFLRGIRNGAFSTGGTIGSIGGGRYLRFANNGNIFLDDQFDQTFSPFSGNQQGGFGSTLRETGQLAAGVDRYIGNLLARFEISPAFQPFLEAKYVHVDAVQEGQPSFFGGGPQTLGGSPIFCDNAFLNRQALGTLQSYGLCTLSDDNGDPILDANGRVQNDPNMTVPLNRFNTDFGGRGEIHKRDTYRIVAGVEGSFNDDWNYEIAANYGRFESDLKSLNNLLLNDIDGNPAGFLLAADAVLDANGNPACRVNTDASAANDAPGCVPINLFGANSPSRAALDFVNTTARRTERAEEFVASANLSGDASQLFELPGGPVAFALGLEYRRETASSVFDDLTASGGTFLNGIQPFNPPAFEVKEAYGEINIPFLADVPFAEELSLGAAGRVSDYNSSVGTVFAYNVQGIYAPVNDIKFRAAYATSVRAPTQSDLFSPQSQNFAQVTDPCDQASINGDPDRVANCAAAGVPTTANAAVVAACAGTSNPLALGDPYLNCLARTQSTSFLQGGNPALVQEEGKSFTAGVILTPRFIPGFSFTVDYYNIEVTNLIAVLGAQTTLNSCYDNDNGIDNVFCSTINRDPTTGLFVEPALLASGVNFASQKTEGIDFDLAYDHSFDNGHRLSVRGILTYLITLNNFTDPADPNNPDRQKSELGDPEFAANFIATYDFGDFDIRYGARFVDRQTIGAYETQNSFNGEPPTNADAFPFVYYPSKLYHDVRIGFDVQNDFRFYAGVDNITDELPPYDLLGTEGGNPYDQFGRYFYAGFSANF